MKIILATASPHRLNAFRQLGLDFEVEGSKVKEDFDGRPEKAEELVAHLSKLKAESVAQKYREGVVIGFDGVGCFNGVILEKPTSKEEAFSRLKSMSGKNYQFYTGIHMIDASSGRVLFRVVKTEVYLRRILDEEIKKYLEQDPQYNTYAEGYDPLGHYSCSFIEKIEGCYNNFLHSTPLAVIVEMLAEVGYKL